MLRLERTVKLSRLFGVVAAARFSVGTRVATLPDRFDEPQDAHEPVLADQRHAVLQRGRRDEAIRGIGVHLQPVGQHRNLGRERQRLYPWDGLNRLGPRRNRHTEIELSFAHQEGDLPEDDRRDPQAVLGGKPGRSDTPEPMRFPAPPDNHVRIEDNHRSAPGAEVPARFRRERP